MYSIPNKKLLAVRKIPRWSADPWHARNGPTCSQLWSLFKEILLFNQILQSRLPPSHFSIHFEAPRNLIYFSNRTNNCTTGRAALLYKSKGACYLTDCEVNMWGAPAGILQQQVACPPMTILELSQKGEVTWLKSHV